MLDAYMMVTMPSATKNAISASLGSGRNVLLNDGAPVFYDADRNAEPRHGDDDAPVQRPVAVHVRRRNEEVRLAPILHPLQALVRVLLDAMRSPQTPTV